MPSVKEITAISRHYSKLGRLWSVVFVINPFSLEVSRNLVGNEPFEFKRVILVFFPGRLYSRNFVGNRDPLFMKNVLFIGSFC